jgi:hypothetical protein
MEQETVDGSAVYRLAGLPVPTDSSGGETMAPRRAAARDAQLGAAPAGRGTRAARASTRLVDQVDQVDTDGRADAQPDGKALEV